MTSGDNSNILAARIARENFGIERVVARIKDPRRAVIYQRLGISDGRHDLVDHRSGHAPPPPGRGAAHEWLDPSGKVCLLDYPIPSGGRARSWRR